MLARVLPGVPALTVSDMDPRELEFWAALVDAGMSAADASALAALRFSRSTAPPLGDVRTLAAGVPGSVLLDWARAGVPCANAADALEAGARLDQLVALPTAYVTTLIPVAPVAARMGVALADVAELLEAADCRRLVAVHALALGFAAADLLAASGRLGVNFLVRSDDVVDRLWEAPSGCGVAPGDSPECRVLVLVLVQSRGVLMDSALAIAAGCTAQEADVAARLLADGQAVSTAVRAAKALTRAAGVSREPQLPVPSPLERPGLARAARPGVQSPGM